MFRNLSLSLSLLSTLCLPGCSGGGGGSATPHQDAPGSVHIVLDTATGSDALVQFQVAAAALERSDGGVTGNLLPEPVLATGADPSGALDGLSLARVPGGNYRALHLVVAPGSGVARYADGSTLPVTLPTELEVVFPEPLRHAGQGRSWLAVGHVGTPPPAVAAGSRAWSPSWSGRSEGSECEFADLRVAMVANGRVLAFAGLGDDGTLEVEFEAECEFEDHPGGRDDFLRGLARGEDLRVRGALGRDGRVRADRAQRGRRNDGPRLLGRIRELFPTTQSFRFEVQAEVRRGGRRTLTTPVDVLVDAAAARLHASDSRRVLTFSELQVDMLAKVEFTSRTPRTGELDLVVAREVEVASSAAPMQPEWEGSVQAVDGLSATITVAQRGNDPIVVQGQVVTQVAVHVGAGVPIERRARSGGGRSTIGLLDIVVGERIWWRGTVTGPASIEASMVRVRAE